MGFWLNPRNKARGFIVKLRTHQLQLTCYFFKLLRFLKKTVADKLLNGTTGAVGDIIRHYAKEFINLQYFPVVE